MNRARPKQIVIRLSEKEFSAVKKKVAKSGLSQQDYLIKCITQKEIYNTDGLKEILPEVKRIGVNINQIAKNSNTNGIVVATEITKIREDLENLWQLLRQLIQKLV